MRLGSEAARTAVLEGRGRQARLVGDDLISILVLLAALGLIIWVLRMYPESAPSLANAAGNEAPPPASPPSGFSLPAWARSGVLFVSALAAGFVCAGLLGPGAVFALLCVAGFALYYRTAEGGAKVRGVTASLKERAATVGEQIRWIERSEIHLGC